MHSISIDRAKSVVERLGNNYTSSQLIGLLDTLLYNALGPLIRHTDFLDLYLANLISMSYGKKRKISSHPEINTSYTRLAVYLLSNNPSEKLAALRASRLDRGFLFLILDDFFTRTENYTSILAECENNTSKERFKLRALLYQIETSVASGPDLLMVINDAHFWYSHAVEFKQILAEKYLRHAVNNAVKLNGRRGFFNIELDDVVQNHALAVSKAIDKFDQGKGTLTSYINNWFMDARNSKNHHITCPNTISIDQESYVEKPQEEVQEEESYEYDTHSPCPTEILEKQQMLDEVRMLAKYADPAGLGRFSLGIEDYLSPEERALLEDYTR